MTARNYIEASGIHEGAVFNIEYPFIWFKYEGHDGSSEMSWRPGIGYRPEPPDSAEPYANAVGLMVLTVVSVHKPGRFPARVFYTRKFISPEGKTFGRGKLHITTAPAFMRRARGFMHPFVIDERERAAA